MTARNDDLGDNASLTPNDVLGDVHASPCTYCGGSGICGSAPDAYFDCPDCSGEAVFMDDVTDDRPRLEKES